MYSFIKVIRLYISIFCLEHCYNALHNNLFLSLVSRVLDVVAWHIATKIEREEMALCSIMAMHILITHSSFSKNLKNKLLLLHMYALPRKLLSRGRKAAFVYTLLYLYSIQVGKYINLMLFSRYAEYRNYCACTILI